MKLHLINDDLLATGVSTSIEALIQSTELVSPLIMTQLSRSGNGQILLSQQHRLLSFYQYTQLK